MPATLTLHSAVDAYTTTGPEDLQVSRMVAALERAWEQIGRVAGGLPEVAIVVASGMEGLQVKRWGHFGAGRWIATDGERRGEVLIAAELLAHGPIAILGTLTHEAAHALAHARGIQDTSRQGRYHNDRYRQIATGLGLVVAKDDRYGWTITHMGDRAVDAYRSTLDDLDAALVGYRAELRGGPAAGPAEPGQADPGGAAPTPGKPAGRLLIVCGCTKPRKLRVSPATLAEGPISCGACGCDFAPEL